MVAEIPWFQIGSVFFETPFIAAKRLCIRAGIASCADATTNEASGNSSTTKAWYMFFPKMKVSNWGGSWPCKGRTSNSTGYEWQLGKDSLPWRVWQSPADSADPALLVCQPASGHIPSSVCFKSLSSLSSNKALFLGELQKNLGFATAIMSSQVTGYFHSFSSDEIVIQMVSQSS